MKEEYFSIKGYLITSASTRIWFIFKTNYVNEEKSTYSVIYSKLRNIYSECQKMNNYDERIKFEDE